LIHGLLDFGFNDQAGGELDDGGVDLRREGGREGGEEGV